MSFSEARLRSATASVASQVTVVPFQEGDGETRSVRMTTRGMRRFGAVDLELTGLPLDPYVLQRATDLLYGIAFVLVKTAEVDTKGFALQVEDVLTVHWRDIQQAYEGTAGGSVVESNRIKPRPAGAARAERYAARLVGPASMPASTPASPTPASPKTMASTPASTTASCVDDVFSRRPPPSLSEAPRRSEASPS